MWFCTILFTSHTYTKKKKQQHCCSINNTKKCLSVRLFVMSNSLFPFGWGDRQSSSSSSSGGDISKNMTFIVTATQKFRIFNVWHRIQQMTHVRSEWRDECCCNTVITITIIFGNTAVARRSYCVLCALECNELTWYCEKWERK